MRKLMLSMLGLAIVHTMLCVVAGSAQTLGDAGAPGSAVATRAVRVGHSIKSIIVATPLRPLEDRPVDVHLRYPADPTGFADAPITFYTSRLYGEPLIAALGICFPRWGIRFLGGSKPRLRANRLQSIRRAGHFP